MRLECKGGAQRRTGRRLLMTAVSSFALLAGAGGANADEFTPIGDLPGGGFVSSAQAVSGDGNTAVGYSDSANHIEAAIWTASGGIVALGDLPGGIELSQAYGVSADGSVVVGYGSGVNGTEAFRWTAATGMVGLGTLGGGSPLSRALGVSADGMVIVGVSNTPSGTEAFQWTSASGMQGLGFLPGSIVSIAYAADDDGSVIVGESLIAAAGLPEAFRWTATNGMEGLGFLPGGGMSSARATSSDGSVIVGFANNASLTIEAFLYDASGMIGLGTLPGGTDSRAYDVSADGTVVVGRSNTASGSIEAFHWTLSDGMRAVEEILTGNGVNLGAWQLTEATGVSADGTVIVGNGFNPSGDSEGWWVRLTGAPPPPPPPPPAPPPPPPPPPPAPPPPPPPAFLSQSVLAASLNSTMAALSSVIAESNLDLLMRTSQAGDRGDRGELRLWGAHAERGLNGRISDAEADEENWGLSYQHSRSLRFGGGLRSTSLDGDLPAFDGEADIETFALQGFAAFEPGDEGLQVYVGALVGTSESAIARGYLNGVTPVWSAGERDGRAFAASVIAAWRFAIADNAQATPFIRLDATHIELDAYAEPDVVGVAGREPQARRRREH